ncbi:MAG: hypothetical protein Q8Q95_03265 [bacterium]|nr:hypothetical protein [bacterium]
MKTIAYYSGKIEIKKGGCYVGEQKIDCPKTGQSLFERPFMQSSVYEPGTSNLVILPSNPSWDIRNDFVFIPIFLAIVLSFFILAIFKIKVFGKTLGEYIKSIWYFIAIAIAAVLWQYLVGVTLEGNSLQLRISQWLWEAMVLASAYKLSKISNFGYKNMFFLGVLYSLIIHGLKVAIRYFFYEKTLWYALDRFLYGSLLVMLIVVGLGFAFILLRNKKQVGILH